MEILKNKSLWALNEYEFDFLNEWNSILNSVKTDKNIAIYSILLLKVNYYLESHLNRYFSIVEKNQCLKVINKSNKILNEFLNDDKNGKDIEKINDSYLEFVSDLRKNSVRRHIFSEIDFLEITSNNVYFQNKGEPTLSHCAWARTFDLVVRWQL